MGEIRMFAGNFAPAGWAVCNGQLLPIAEYDALFSLIGTTYGGDGQSTFGLPDLRGRLPIHQGGGYTLASGGGVETVTLTTAQLPAHPHALYATNNLASGTSPANQALGATQAATITPYGTDNPVVALGPGSISAVGSNAAHDNFQPFLCVNFIIALFGVYPSQS
jgi:microcystin-dependent protein